MTLLTVLLALAGTLSATWSRPITAQETIAISVGDTWFCNQSFQGGVCETVVDAADTIVWDFSGAQLPHTTTECGASCDDPTGSPLWDSGIIVDASTFQFTLTEPGTYLYLCTVHPILMRGRIIVQVPEEEPTATEPIPVVDFPPPTTPIPAETEVTDVPATGQGPGEASSRSWWMLAGLGVATHRRGRRRQRFDG